MLSSLSLSLDVVRLNSVPFGVVRHFDTETFAFDCEGKTSVANALTALFPMFGHTQSDDVKSRKTAPTFQRNITELLKKNDVVVADRYVFFLIRNRSFSEYALLVNRNNHLTQHREGIRAAALASRSTGGLMPIRLVALNWSLNALPLSTIHRLCATRVVARGENHQSLRPSTKISHEDIIWQFISGAEELGDKEVDSVIEMDVASESLESSVRTAVDKLIPLLQKWVAPPSGAESWMRPSEQEIQDACDVARGYKVALKKDDGSLRGAPAARYYAFLPEIDVTSVVDSVLSSSTPTSPPFDINSFWSELKSSNRLTKRPHITIAHKLNLPQDQALWDASAAIDRNKANPPLFNFKLGTLLCDGQVMSVTVIVNEPTAATSDSVAGDDADERVKFLDLIPDYKMKQFHITVGTKEDSIKAIEGGNLVARWKAGDTGIIAIPLNDKTIEIVGRVRGLAG